MSPYIKTKNKRYWSIIFIFLFLIVVGWISMFIYNHFYNLQKVPKGEYLQSSTSPDNTYKVNFYLANGGATTSTSIRGELEDLKTKKTKNIYWNSPEESVRVIWTDESTVIINGREIKLPDGKFDYRREDDSTP